MPSIDYFLAGSDADARATLKRGFIEDRSVVDGLGIDPVVDLMNLEHLMTSEPPPSDEDHSPFPTIAAEPNGATVVYAIPDSLALAISASSPATLQALAASWSGADEFGGLVPLDELTDFLERFGQLARYGRQQHLHVYCRVRA